METKIYYYVRVENSTIYVSPDGVKAESLSVDRVDQVNTAPHCKLVRLDSKGWRRLMAGQPIEKVEKTSSQTTVTTQSATRDTPERVVVTHQKETKITEICDPFAKSTSYNGALLAATVVAMRGAMGAAAVINPAIPILMALAAGTLVTNESHVKKWLKKLL